MTDSQSAVARAGAALPLRFDEPGLLHRLHRATRAELDEADFGVIGMAHDGTVESYNRWEAAASGLDPARVLGRNFFTGVARCIHNEQVSLRYMREQELDVTMEYTFAFRLRIRQVRLRILRSSAVDRMYLVVTSRSRA